MGILGRYSKTVSDLDDDSLRIFVGNRLRNKKKLCYRADDTHEIYCGDESLADSLDSGVYWNARRKTYFHEIMIGKYGKGEILKIKYLIQTENCRLSIFTILKF